jgi:hypothetical protein
MQISAERVERLGRSLDLALNQEWPQLVRVERTLAQLQVIPIPTAAAAPLLAIATVATDGGENKLSLDPIRLQIIRVADSRGEIYFEDFVPQSLQPEEIVRFFFKSDPKLQRFLAYLEVKWEELLPTGDFQRSHLLQMLRELMEWAALLQLASKSPSCLLIRDGLLRSVMLPKMVFAQMSQKFKMLTATHGHLLVGISKRSQIVNYLTVAFGLNQSFAAGEPSYVRIPLDLEREAAPPRYSWMNTRHGRTLHRAARSGPQCSAHAGGAGALATGQDGRGHGAPASLRARKFPDPRLPAGARPG